METTGSQDFNARFSSKATRQDDSTALPPAGLVQASDLRKRRLVAEEAPIAGLSGRFANAAGSMNTSDREATPQSEDGRKKRKKSKSGAKVKLSFAADDEDAEDDYEIPKIVPRPKILDSSSNTLIPKVQTKAALLKEQALRESLRKTFLTNQAAVKETEIVIPFVFYDGSNTPGGVCRLKKGDQVWLFLDKARKLGAETATVGAGAAQGAKKTRGDWARIGVDDLLVVRGEVVLPHHYEIYYFILNQSKGPNGRRLFDYTNDPPPAPTQDGSALISVPSEEAAKRKPDHELEGADQDPALTKVVDRRWYERNKHIFPASMWQDFDPEKVYEPGARRRDPNGNSFFFV